MSGRIISGRRRNESIRGGGAVRWCQFGSKTVRYRLITD